MNQRIRQLTEQAISDVDYIRDDDFTNEELSQMYIPDCFAEKFAELIVRECYEHCRGQVLDKEVADTNELTYNDAVSDCANGLLQHFGVDE